MASTFWLEQLVDMLLTEVRGDWYWAEGRDGSEIKDLLHSLVTGMSPEGILIFFFFFLWVDGEEETQGQAWDSEM